VPAEHRVQPAAAARLRVPREHNRRRAGEDRRARRTVRDPSRDALPREREVQPAAAARRMAAVAGWRVVRAQSLRTAGIAMYDAIVSAALSQLGLILSQRAARQL
jgi:hypothetical protein